MVGPEPGAMAFTNYFNFRATSIAGGSDEVQKYHGEVGAWIMSHPFSVGAIAEAEALVAQMTLAEKLIFVPARTFGT